MNTVAKLGDKIEVLRQHRFGGKVGTIVAYRDNPWATDHHYHIRFHEQVDGAIKGKEIWMSDTDFRVLEKASADYQPPEDIELAGVWED